MHAVLLTYMLSTELIQGDFTFTCRLGDPVVSRIPENEMAGRISIKTDGMMNNLPRKKSLNFAADPDNETVSGAKRKTVFWFLSASPISKLCLYKGFLLKYV